MVAAEGRTIHVYDVADIGDVVETGAGGVRTGGVGQGHETAEPDGPGVEATGGDLIVGEREAGEWVLDVPDTDTGEVTRLHGECGVGKEGRGGLALAEAFVGSKEEGFIADNGTTAAQTELVAIERRPLLAVGVVEVGVGR